MKQRLLCFLMSLTLLLPMSLTAQTFVNLTPKPKSMTVSTGALTLPSQFTISYTGLDEASVNELNLFATSYAEVTGSQVTVAADDANALFQVSLLPTTNTLKEGGYTLQVTASKVTIKAKNALGFFYALQSVKKMLPANVMAGAKDASVTSYILPLVNITDEPRYAYRGFMLDVSRHFFTIDEVKRMIDVMSYYKMNAFHWHLSDDQGWRVEIKKYPRLTSVGSIAPNSRFTDMYECAQYWINKAYGPYYYTQDQLKEVVAYAQARHITIIPEIDMPGHFCAALTSYPEYSCTPNGTHVVQIDGGIYSDVLNVANPAAVQFTKDILGELIDIFPGEYIHIGGDECPTSAWQSNAECQAQYKKLGLTDYRQLQSHFIQELANYVKEKGRKLAIWNEGITASGADLNIMKATDATVYCWTSPEAAAQKAKQLGMANIYTPWGPYYINRKQGNSELDPPGAGYGTDDVKATYNQAIPDATDYGVQGTFWTEHVSDADYMEWLALPRLIAIAERGWTTEANKNFEDFRKRMSADTVMLNYGNYKYCKYYMIGYTKPTAAKVMPFTNTTEKKYYYRLISGGTDATRVGRCIEVLASGSSLISANSSKGAKVGVLWTSPQASEGDSNYDYQWWSLEQAPSNPDKYALVCKALPDGSINPTPTATSTSGRWNYDNTTKHYNFELGTGAYGQKGDNYYYTIASDKASGQYFNSSMSGQGLAVNLYNNPNDGNGGQWEFAPMEDYGSNVTPVTFDYLQAGKDYVFANAADGFNQDNLVDDNVSTSPKTAGDGYDDLNNAWRVETSTINADGSQTVSLKNVNTGRYIASTSSFVSNLGCPVNLASTGTDKVTIALDTRTGALRLKVDGKSLFPLPSGVIYAGSNIQGASYDAASGQGAVWYGIEVNVNTYNCKDTEGNLIAVRKLSVPVDYDVIENNVCPPYKNHTVESITKTGDNTYDVVYKRSAYAVTYQCVDDKGVMVDKQEVNAPVGESYKVALPTPKYYTLKSSTATDGEMLDLTADTTIKVVYTTDAITGVKMDGDVVTQLQAGKSYLFYDATDASGRAGYRLIQDDTKKVNRSTTAEGLTPAAIWTLEGMGKQFKVKNEYYGLYVPQLVRSTATTASKTGGTFTFNLNSDGETWNIKGSNGQYWDGTADGNLVGWDGGTGHPIRITTFYAQPMYTVEVICKDADDNVLSQTSELLAAGSSYTLTIPSIEGYELQGVTGNENYTGTVEGYLTLTATYNKTVDGIQTVEADRSSLRSGIYDLQGRKLPSVHQRGIYIINGQKVLVK